MTTQQDGGTLEPAQIEAVVGAAAAAPSILNCQPWWFHAHDGLVDVHAVPEQAPSILDPTGREVFLSLGAAVLNLRLAVAALGRVPAVQLLPTPSAPRLVARLRIGGPGRLSDLERPLFEAIPGRRSSRVPFSGEQIPYEDFMHLQEAAAAEGGHLDAATGLHRDSVVDLLHEADRAQRGDRALIAEVARWTVDLGRPDVGIPRQSLGPRPRDPAATVRDLTLGGPAGDRPAADFETSALLAVLLTTGDHPIDWLRGGLALERVLLTATARGLSVGVLSHATEVTELRPLVRDPSSRWLHPQLVLRFGHGEPMPPTPRRPLGEVLQID
jgi:nitroreductase